MSGNITQLNSKRINSKYKTEKITTTEIVAIMNQKNQNQNQVYCYCSTSTTKLRMGNRNLRTHCLFRKDYKCGNMLRLISE